MRKKIYNYLVKAGVIAIVAIFLGSTLSVSSVKLTNVENILDKKSDTSDVIVGTLANNLIIDDFKVREYPSGSWHDGSITVDVETELEFYIKVRSTRIGGHFSLEEKNILHDKENNFISSEYNAKEIRIHEDNNNYSKQQTLNYDRTSNMIKIPEGELEELNDFFSIPLAVVIAENQSPNDTPFLWDPYVDPEQGDTGDSYTFWVTYSDPDDDSAVKKLVFINGISHEMTYDHGNNWEGAVYRYETLLSEDGVYQYYFVFNDGFNDDVRLPQSSYFYGPIVSPTGNADIVYDEDPRGYSIIKTIINDDSWQNRARNGDTVMIKGYGKFFQEVDMAKLWLKYDGAEEDVGQKWLNKLRFYKGLGGDPANPDGECIGGPLLDYVVEKYGTTDRIIAIGLQPYIGAPNSETEYAYCVGSPDDTFILGMEEPYKPFVLDTNDDEIVYLEFYFRKVLLINDEYGEDWNVNYDYWGTFFEKDGQAPYDGILPCPNIRLYYDSKQNDALTQDDACDESGPSDSATVLNVGNRYDGYIEKSYYGNTDFNDNIDQYKISINKNEECEITFESPKGSNGIDLLVYDTDKNTLKSENNDVTDEITIQITPTGDGFLYVIIRAETRYDRGKYFIKAIINEIPNNPPDKPSKPSGPTTGLPGTTYTYSSSTTDPDGDQVYYWFDWDDGTNSGWTGSSASHTWNEEGIYSIKVKAKDSHGAESEWSYPLTVTVEDDPDDDPPYVEITRPDGGIYIGDNLFMSLGAINIIIGRITIEVDASDESGIDRVEFYIDDVKEHTDFSAPYEWTWTDAYMAKTKEIKAVAYDNVGNSDSNEIMVWKFF